MNDNIVLAEQVMLNYYVRYDVLSSLVSQNEELSNAKRVHIYIDLYDVFKKLWHEYNATHKYAIVSYLMNMVAHYRRFFAKLQCDTEIFLVYGDCTSMNHKQFIPEFGDDGFAMWAVQYPITRSIIDGQLELVKILAAYFKDVYFVRRTSNFSVFVYDRIRSNPIIEPSILITKALYAYQVSAMLGRNVMILRPRKYKGGDFSEIISSNNVMMSYFSHVKNYTVVDTLSRMNPQLFSLMLTMTGLRNYNLKGVCNSTQACKIISNALSRSMIINGYNTDIDYVYDSLNGIEKYVDKDTFRFRFYAVDLVYQHRIYGGMPESMDNTWCINLYDPESVKEINDKYFYDTPIDITSL